MIQAGVAGGASADIVVLNPWTVSPQISSGNSISFGAPFVVGAAPDRLMIVAVCPGFTGAAGSVAITADYGGVAIAPIGTSDATQRRIVWLGYAKESDLAGRSGDFLHVALSTNVNLSGTNVYVSSYSGVDQTSPIEQSNVNYLDNMDVPVGLASPLAVEAGGYGVFVMHVQNSTNPFDGGPDAYSFSNGVQSGTSGNYSRVAGRALPGAGVTNVAVSYGAIRAGVVGATLRPAPSAVGVGESDSDVSLSLRVFPNPASHASRIELVPPRSGPVELDIFDGRGRHVRQLSSGDIALGAHSFVWDGCDDRGHECPVGLYYVRAGSAGAVRVARIVRLSAHGSD